MQMWIENFYKALIIVSFFLLFPIKASLMMSLDEVNLLNELAPIEDEATSFLETPEILTSCFTIEEILFLSAILYLSPTHWSVWINDRTYTADDMEDNTLKITKVTNHYVEFELKDSHKKTLKLRSNQSLITIGHRIVDGDARQKQQLLQL